MIVSHIDDDHIGGLINMTEKLMDSDSPRFEISNLWHNTFDNIIGHDAKELLSVVTASFGPAALSGEPDLDGLDSSASKVLASVGQGITLRQNAQNPKLGIPINSSFGQAEAAQLPLIMAIPNGKPIKIGNELQFTVIGPMKDELQALQDEHDNFLTDLKEKLKKNPNDKDAKKLLQSYTDDSVANLSSIVLLVEVGEKRILLTGDARGDKILAGLKLAGLLKDGTMHVDILKMPHHGSDRNMDEEFLRQITADHYVFSGNGDDGNPERATLEYLWNARGSANYTVHLTYDVGVIDTRREAVWLRKNKIKNRTWTEEEKSLLSLQCFLDNDKHGDFNKKIITIEGKKPPVKSGEYPVKPHVIDLLDELGY
jgi:hypothetical protein